MKKTLVLMVAISSIFFFDCSRSIGNRGGGNAGGRAGSYDTLGRVTNNDPDGIIGNGSTYGTGTGVSGQTPAGTGSGTGNTGRSGVGVKEDLK